MILKIRKLYKIEKDIKDDPPDIKQKIREEKSKPIIDDIRLYVDEYNRYSYCFRWLYLKDGKLNIDNNVAENHVRPIAANTNLYV